MSIERLDKFLANSNLGTRTKVKEYLKAGRVTVNSKTEKDGSLKIDTEKDKVSFDGVEVVFEKFRYYMLNKPAGCVSATRDKLSDTVLDIFKDEDTRDLFPVGRLDKDTEGLLLITNDGDFAHNVLSPKKHVDKTYFATLDKRLDEKSKKKVENGIYIGDDKPCLPAKVEILDDTDVKITISEGRYHQVKRMFEAVGYEVVYLKRISMGGLKLDERLREGEYKKLTPKDIEECFKIQRENENEKMKKG